MADTKPVVSLALFTILSRIVGFLRVIAIGALLGTTVIGNTFQSTNSVSNVLFDLLVAGALSAALVPQLSVALHKSEKDFNDIVRSLLGVVSIILGVITVLGFIFAHQLSEMLFRNVPDAQQYNQVYMGTRLIRYFIPQVFFYGIGAISIAALSAKKVFSPAAYAPIASSFVLVIGLFFYKAYVETQENKYSTTAIMILGLTGTLACIAFVAIPFFTALKHKINLIPKFNLKLGFASLKTSTWAIAIQAAAAVILAVSIYIGNEQPGAVVAYQIGFVFLLAPYAIISQSFATVVLPEISVQAANTDSKEHVDLFKINVEKTFAWTYIPLSLISALVISIALPLSNLISIGEAKNGTKLFELVLISLFAGLLPYGLFQTAARIFFAKSNVKVPALIVLIFSLVISAFAIVVTKSSSTISTVTVMGLTHSFVYVFAAIVLIFLLARQGLNALPNRLSLMITFISVVVAPFGYWAASAIEPTGKLTSLIYIAVVGFIFVAIGFIVTPKQNRSKAVTMVRKKLHV